MTRKRSCVVREGADGEGPVLVPRQRPTSQRYPYYVLGDHGLCGNPDWASCLYRMACIKCPFFVPKDRVQLMTACKTVKRFLEVVELTDEELAVVRDDHSKLEEAVERTRHLPAPTLLRRRAKGARESRHSFNRIA